MLVQALHGMTVTNKMLHSAMIEKNNELISIRQVMESMQATLNQTLKAIPPVATVPTSSINNTYRGGDIVDYTGKNKTHQLPKIYHNTVLNQFY